MWRDTEISGIPNMACAAIVPAMPPESCAAMYGRRLDQSNPPSIASATETTGLKCAPEMGPKVRISTTSAAPVVIVFASKANAPFPLASRSAMMPEPTTAATKSTLDLLVRAFSLRGIGNAPMCRHWLSGPNGTHFLGGVVANGENEIHLRRSGLCELFPVLAAQAFHGQACQANQLESFRTHDSRRVASRAESCEKRPALTVENCLGHDGTSRIPRAQE